MLLGKSPSSMDDVVNLTGFLSSGGASISTLVCPSVPPWKKILVRPSMEKNFCPSLRGKNFYLSLHGRKFLSVPPWKKISDRPSVEKNVCPSLHVKKFLSVPSWKKIWSQNKAIIRKQNLSVFISRAVICFKPPPKPKNDPFWAQKRFKKNLEISNRAERGADDSNFIK